MPLNWKTKIIAGPTLIEGFSAQVCPFFVVIGVCLFCSNLHAQTSKSTYATAVNIAGKQRMLSQKISKEVLLIKLNPSATNNLSTLTDTATQFNEAQLGLIYGSDVLGLPKLTNPEHVKKMQSILSLWQEYYAALENSVAIRVIDDRLIDLVTTSSDQLLVQLEEMVLIFQQTADQKLSDIPDSLPNTINMSGRQRMLSQKMAKECLLIEANLDREVNIQNLANSQAVFEKVLNGLIRGNKDLNLQVEPSFELKQQLTRVADNWRAFSALLDACGTSKDEQALAEFIDSMAHQNLVLLRNMNRVVEMYESMAFQKTN